MKNYGTHATNKKQNDMVILITGKSGAGKTHYAKTLTQELQINGVDVVMIDADEYRKERGTTKPEDFSDAGRTKNLIGAAKLAAEFEREGKTVVMAFIAPRRIWRATMRQYWQESRVVYIPGGDLWEGTTYEEPTDDELQIRRN